MFLSGKKVSKTEIVIDRNLFAMMKLRSITWVHFNESLQKRKCSKDARSNCKTNFALCSYIYTCSWAFNYNEIMVKLKLTQKDNSG